MSRTDDLFALCGNSRTRDPKGRNARLHFFGTLPFDDGTRVNQKDGSRFSTHAPSANEQPQPYDLSAPCPTVVALVSVNGGVGRSTLVTALSSGLQRLGESVVALDVDPELLGVGRASLLNTRWETLLQAGFAGCQVIPFGNTGIQQKDNLQGWLTREPKWLAQHLSTLGLSERQIMLIDTPAGDNVYLHQALSVADFVLVVVQPNAACLGTLDQLDAVLAGYLEREHPPQRLYVINQLDERSAFSLDMVDAFKLRLGDRPLEVVHREPSISEALAFATDPLDKLAASVACDDINDLCRLLIARKKAR